MLFSDASSTEIILILDLISVPEVFISAYPKYLLSGEIHESTATVLDKYDLNSSFPYSSYVVITDL